MDIMCPICAEPWDNDTLHDFVEDGVYQNYTEAAKNFRKVGCAAFSTPHNEATEGSFAAQVSSVMFDLLGDDMDGASAMMDDFEYLGLLEE